MPWKAHLEKYCRHVDSAGDLESANPESFDCVLVNGRNLGSINDKAFQQQIEKFPGAVYIPETFLSSYEHEVLSQNCFIMNVNPSLDEIFEALIVSIEEGGAVYSRQEDSMNETEVEQLKVLVAEDNETNLEVFTHMLKTIGGGVHGDKEW